MAGTLLSTELASIPGLGSKFTARLQKLNIKTVGNLLWHFPFRYEDYSSIVPIGELSLDQSATVQGKIHQLNIRRTWKKNFLVIEAIIVDETGGIKAVWFNQPYIIHSLKEGKFYNFAGKVTKSKREIYLASPSFEPMEKSARGETRHTAGLIPIYPETKGLTSKGLRFLIKNALKELEPPEDFLPEEILKEYQLPALRFALRRIHFPLKISDAEAAKNRFAFEDLLLLQLNNIRLKSRLAQEQAEPLKTTAPEMESLTSRLPFILTESQKISLKEILEDLQKSHPMNRLMQGDVGSGKTVIAALAAMVASKNNFQTAFMAPTEVLAGQHYRTITSIFPDFNQGIALLTANKNEIYGQEFPKIISKAKLLKIISEGGVKIVIGTHALIQKNIAFHNLALAIVDEQHRFGVRQRATLASPVGAENDPNRRQALPHFLSMSATPIPRTIALSVFGDLDLSTITELPAGRKKIITKIVAPENRLKAYQFIREQIAKGRQIFVICPRIQPGTVAKDEILTEAKKKALELKSVTEEHKKLSSKIFPELKIAMLHGKMSGKEKDEIMRDFQGGQTDILVATSVIEVGVDVPNAAIIMIEGAERFGLAQLYQFRGRVGRSTHQSFCFLFTDSGSESVTQRLEYLITAKNGFELAEKDLLIRGPGQFLGESQTGLPDIAMDALKNVQLVKMARDSAKKLLSNDPELGNYPALAKKMEEFQKTTHLE